MRTIIAGGRDFADYELVRQNADQLDPPATQVVCGEARVIDTFSRRWAKSRGIGVQRFPAEWGRYGSAAEPVRNRAMATYAERLLAFWDGVSPCTQNMIEAARELRLEVIVVPYVAGRGPAPAAA